MLKNFLNKVTGIGASIGSKLGSAVVSAFNRNNQTANVLQGSGIPGSLTKKYGEGSGYIDPTKNIGGTTGSNIPGIGAKTPQYSAPGMTPAPLGQTMTYAQTNPYMTINNPGQSMSSDGWARPSTYFDAQRGVMQKFDLEGNLVSEQAVQGTSGAGGSSTQSFNTPFLASQGTQGAFGGGSAFTGLLSSGGGLSTPSVMRSTPTDSTDPFTNKKREKGLQNQTTPSGVPGFLSPQMQERLPIPAFGQEFNAGDLLKSRLNSQQTLSTREAQSVDDRAETFARIESNIQENLAKAPLSPEMPVVDTPEQIDFLSMFPEEDRFDIRKTMDGLRSSSGLTQLESQKIEVMKQLQATNEAFQKITDDVKNNPDLPKGLALRRVQEVQKTQKDRVLQLTGQLEILGEQISVANEAINREFQIQKMQFDMEQQKKSQDRELLQLMISSGAIGGFSPVEVQQWVSKTGMPASVINNLIKASQQPNVKVEGNPKDGYVKVITSKNGDVRVEQIAGGNITGGFERATELRKEYNSLPETKNASVVQSYFQQAQAGAQQYNQGNRASGQQTVINALAKILGPDSVVRESEYAISAGGQSALNNLQGLYDKYVKGGQGLSPEGLQGIMSTITAINAGYVSSQNQKINFYRQQAQQVGANPNDVAQYLPTAGILNPQSAKEGDILILNGSPFQKQGDRMIELEPQKKSTDPVSMLMDAIGSVESSGKYTAVGPTTKDGNRAYGKYQIMDFNIPVWTREALGQSMTVQQFLSNPLAQDAVAKFKMNQYLQKYGTPQAAAAVWFSGRPDVNNSAKDITGTSVPEYVARVIRQLENA